MPNINLSKANSRAALSPRREPYFGPRIAPGLFLGYRSLETGGTWIARQRSQDNKQNYLSLGPVDAMEYTDALKAATKWGKELMDGVGKSEIKTVRDICKAYVEDRRREKGEEKAIRKEDVFRIHVLKKSIADMPLKQITTKDIKEWRSTLASVQANVVMKNDSKDRILTDLKSALNYAVNELHIVSADRALEWKRVKPFGENNRRSIYLTTDERDRLLASAEDSIKPFIRAACLLPVRCGAMSKLRVEALRDKNPGYETLYVNEDKANGKRDIPLSVGMLKFFREQAKGKLPKAYLFTDENGEPWSKGSWYRAVNRARIAAGLQPGVCLYTLRHCMITDLITIGGMDIVSVAYLAGTSIKEINDHYGKLNAGVTRERLTAMAL